MKNTIIKLFNLEPDELEDVQFISEGNRAFILITLKRVRQRCPQCGSSTKVVHDYRKHTLTHAILNDQNTSIVILLFFYLSLFFSTSYFFEIITIYAINKTIITASSIMFAANIPIPMPATTEPFAFEPAD